MPKKTEKIIEEIDALAKQQELLWAQLDLDQVEPAEKKRISEQLNDLMGSLDEIAKNLDAEKKSDKRKGVKFDKAPDLSNQENPADDQKPTQRQRRGAFVKK